MRDAIFQSLLAEYEFEPIRLAFMEYLKSGTEVPTPADILKILDPTTQPLSEAMYVRLSQKRANGDKLDTMEWKYIRRFEDNEYRKLG